MGKNKALELTVRIAGRVDKSLLASVRQTNSMLGTLTSATAKVGKVGLAAMAAGAGATACLLYTSLRGPFSRMTRPPITTGPSR